MKEIKITNKQLDEWSKLNIEHMLELIEKQKPRYVTKIIIDEETGEPVQIQKIYKLPLGESKDG
jgi:hypothetical protein